MEKSAEDELDLDEAVCGNIANLSAAISNLEEIDPALLSQNSQKDLKRMKQQIFKALKYYCTCLPEENENT